MIRLNLIKGNDAVADSIDDSSANQNSAQDDGYRENDDGPPPREKARAVGGRKRNTETARSHIHRPENGNRDG